MATSLCTVSSHEDTTRMGQKLKRTVENLGYYAPPYFENMPQKDPYSDAVSFSGYRSSFSAPFDVSIDRSEMAREDPSHSSEHLMFEGEEIDEDYPHSHLGDPSGGDYKHKSAQVSHSEEEERVQTSYVFSDKPTYRPIVNSYENYCPQPAHPQPILPIDLPMLRPDLPYPVIRDRVYAQKPKNFNAILENFKKLSEQEGLLIDYPSAFPTSFELLKKRLRERPVRPRTDRILMNVFQNEDPRVEFLMGSEELTGSYRPRVSSFPLQRISNARGGYPNYEREYNYGQLQNPIEYKYGSPKELQSSSGFRISEPYFRPYHIMEKSNEGSFPNFKVSIL